METILEKIKELVDDCFIEKYGDINWHCDYGKEKQIMEKESRDLQFEVQELIENRLKELDDEIQDWEEENHEQWETKEIADIKTDLVYEYNNNL